MNLCAKALSKVKAWLGIPCNCNCENTTLALSLPIRSVNEESEVRAGSIREIKALTEHLESARVFAVRGRRLNVKHRGVSGGRDVRGRYVKTRRDEKTVRAGYVVISISRRRTIYA